MEFHMTLDFRDDFTAASVPWTAERLREYIRLVADLGMQGIHWIEMGDKEMGKWDRGSSTDLTGGARAFVESVPDPLAFVCEEAHHVGLKVYAVHKINDMASFGPGRFYPLGTAPDVLPGIPQIGGSGQMAFRWLREHPDRRVEIHPSLLEAKGIRKPVRTIRFWHETDRLQGVPYIELLVSETNARYTPYRGSCRVDVSVRRRTPPVFAPAPERRFAKEGEFACIQISGLEISQPFFGIRFAGAVGLTNTLTALVEVEDVSGAPVVFTWGFFPRSDYSTSLGTFEEAGIGFDANWLIPFENHPGGHDWQHSAGRYRLNVDKVPFIGIARGRNRFLTSSVELAYPDVRRWLLDIVQYELDAGCDGVDIRVESHTQNMDFENYGFGKPVVEAFRDRYGVDITRESFDRGAWRELRGEYFDLFLKDASELIRSHGKETWIHLTAYPSMDREPRQQSLSQIYWNWRRWMAEGWVDVVNFKRFQARNLSPGQQEEIDRFYRKALNFCGELGLRTAYTPNPRFEGMREEDFVDMELRTIRRIAGDGFEVYNFYEGCTYIRLTENGFQVNANQLWREVREWNRKAGLPPRS
ncbi:MAG: hypothetical protein OYM47_02460 [Gemmatimonadota bacterium]|nr:hypothetical protein [Gemmatimonadota bacterium]